MNEKLKSALLAAAWKVGELVTILAGVAIMFLLVSLSSLVGLDLTGIVSEEQINIYAISIGSVAGYGIQQWIKDLIEKGKK